MIFFPLFLEIKPILLFSWFFMFIGSFVMQYIAGFINMAFQVNLFVQGEILHYTCNTEKPKPIPSRNL